MMNDSGMSLASENCFNETQSQVINVIKASSSDIGINLDEICSHLPIVKREEIKDALDFLLNEGKQFVLVCFRSSGDTSTNRLNLFYPHLPQRWYLRGSGQVSLQIHTLRLNRTTTALFEPVALSFVLVSKCVKIEKFRTQRVSNTLYPQYPNALYATWQSL